ncbi:hypothetical protein D9V34_11660 [Mycetocola lacteus]|uniref:Uncharacterized protein n=1 Tax=Mycetocola lacteus TaxID=76637 RepID=A0A3L7API8_9MICO|nr:hypothetical protein [Mycetocola lacteus]RLP82423.1 hypothetical protein D9V34_11660 [Mycetocola lacteus]
MTLNNAPTSQYSPIPPAPVQTGGWFSRNRTLWVSAAAALVILLAGGLSLVIASAAGAQAQRAAVSEHIADQITDLTKREPSTSEPETGDRWSDDDDDSWLDDDSTDDPEGNTGGDSGLPGDDFSGIELIKRLTTGLSAQDDTTTRITKITNNLLDFDGTLCGVDGCVQSVEETEPGHFVAVLATRPGVTYTEERQETMNQVTKAIARVAWASGGRDLEVLTLSSSDGAVTAVYEMNENASADS